MSYLKKCSKCEVLKHAEKDFYFCQGKWRTECRQCTIKRNIQYQKKIQYWKARNPDDDRRRSDKREYYEKNKQKFAEYRENFKQKNPGYYKEYYKNKQKKEGCEPHE